MTVKLREVLDTATLRLHAVSDSARLDAELLLQRAIGRERAWLYAYADSDVTQEQQTSFHRMLQRRQRGEPIAYILGCQEFYGLLFHVDKHVLIPRPATECMVDWVLDHYKTDAIRVLDLGTGSGAIAVALAKHRPAWNITAVDVSSEALAVAKQNAGRHNCHSIRWLESDWFNAVKGETFDLILSNPPYIDANDPHMLDLCFEPHTALVAEANGLACIDHILSHAWIFLRKPGAVVIEHGFDQSKAVTELADKHGWLDPVDHLDLAGQPRYLVARSE